jgi:hypothetical protein
MRLTDLLNRPDRTADKPMSLPAAMRALKAGHIAPPAADALDELVNGKRVMVQPVEPPDRWKDLEQAKAEQARQDAIDRETMRNVLAAKRDMATTWDVTRRIDEARAQLDGEDHGE